MNDQFKLLYMSCINHEFSINISHSQTWEECTGYFRVDEERGLSPAQVEEHKKKYGPNGEFQLLRC